MKKRQLQECLKHTQQINRQLMLEISELKLTRIRISVPTENGIRPVYDCDLEFVILVNRAHGGNGITAKGPGEWIHGPVIVEVISQWNPLRDDEDE